MENIFIKRPVYRLLVALMCLGISPCVHAQKLINLSDYGVVSGSYQNASPAIARAINDASDFDSCIIRFPGGRIDLWPDGASRHTYYISNATESDSLSKEKTIGMLFKGLSNIILEGNNTLLIYHGKMMLMAIDHCHNFKVENLRFDFQRPTMSEMRIGSETDSTVIVGINSDSWYDIGHNHKLIWYGEGWRTYNPFVAGYRPPQETMYYSSWEPFKNSDAAELSPFKVKFTGNFDHTIFKAGDVLTIRDPYRDEVGIFNNRSHNVAFKNLKLHYMHGLGIVSQLSGNISFSQVDVVPRLCSGRVIAAFADCFHFSNCYGLIRIENCLFSGTHDDPVNVHGTYLRVIKSDSTKVIVRFMHHQTWGFNIFDIGDSVQFVNHQTLLPIGTRVIRSSRMVSKREIELILDRPAPSQIREGDGIGNISKTPTVVIKDNRFEHVLTRGLLITTRRKVLIERNVFYRTGMHAILIADDCNSWYESGPVKDIIIRGNKFLDCAYRSSPDNYIIAIKPETDHFEKNKYVHSNIVITGNTFQVFDTPLLFARDVKGLNFSDNKIIEEKLWGFPTGDRPAFNLEHCNRVLIQHNNFKGEHLQKEIRLRGMEKKAIKYKPSKAFYLTSCAPG